MALACCALPLTARAQEALPSLDLGSTTAQLQSAAMGLAQGCDYMRYLRTADQMQGAFQSIRTMEQIRNGAAFGQRAGVPFTDYIKLVMNAVSNRLNVDAAKSLRKGLVLQVEQVCSNVIQGDEVRRMLEITRDAQVGAAEAIPSFAKLFEQRTSAQVDTTLKSTIDSAFYSSAKVVVPVVSTDRTDSLMLKAINNAEQVTRYARLSLMAIDSIEENLRRISDESYLFAEPDSGGTWKCPAGYPAPRMAPELTRKPKPICGPAGSERSVQLVRALAEENVRLKIVDSRVIPLLATMEAYTILMDAHNRRIGQAVRVKTYMP